MSYLEISITWPTGDDNKLLTNREFQVENTRAGVIYSRLLIIQECIATKTRPDSDKIVKEMSVVKKKKGVND